MSKITHPVAVVARDMVQGFMSHYAMVVRTHKKAGQDTAAAFIDGLSGAMALQIAGGHAPREVVEEACIERLRACLSRDLNHLARQ